MGLRPSSPPTGEAFRQTPSPRGAMVAALSHLGTAAGMDLPKESHGAVPMPCHLSVVVGSVDSLEPSTFCHTSQEQGNWLLQDCNWVQLHN